MLDVKLSVIVERWPGMSSRTPEDRGRCCASAIGELADFESVGSICSSHKSVSQCSHVLSDIASWSSEGPASATGQAPRLGQKSRSQRASPEALCKVSARLHVLEDIN